MLDSCALIIQVLAANIGTCESYLSFAPWVNLVMPNQLPLSLPEIIAILAIGLLCFLIGALFNQKKTRSRWQLARETLIKEHQQLTETLNDELDQLQDQLNQAANELQQKQIKHEHDIATIAQLEAKAERIPHLEQALEASQSKLMQTQLSLSKANAMQQTILAKSDAEKAALEDKLTLLENTEQRLKLEFESLANRVLEDRSEKLTSQNNGQLESVLGPLKQQLEGFRRQVHESYTQEQSQRSALFHQLEQLQNLNLKMSEDAINLTRALKGDNKQQGNWGEVILERVLTESGLRQGHEYDIQQDLKNDQGKRFKPDVIVHLPEGKDVVIDAKMSLTAYERYFNTQDETLRLQAQKEHVQSIRQHIKGLGEKDYHKLHGIKSLDYVLMFIPVEAAFLLGLENEPELVNYALERNIMLVSPTNLLVALRTINNIWRFEYQNQHAQKIASQAGKIYDKLCGYIEDMNKLGRAMETADKSYQQAMNKLVSGKGNLVKQAHQMKQLGVETSKQIDKSMLDTAMNEEVSLTLVNSDTDS